MGVFTPTNSWSNALKYVGRSDARQVRQILDFINLIEYGQYPFCRLLGGKAPGQAGQEGNEDFSSPVIPSQEVITMTPEIYDFETSADSFRLTADTAAIDVDGTATLTLDTNAGLNIGDIIAKVDQDAHAIITSLTGSTQCAITVIYSANGSVVWSSDTSISYIQKLGNARSDGYQVTTGNDREPTNRSNYLQFQVVPMSQGILQKNVELYAAGGSAANSEWLQEKKRKMYEFQKQRESQFIGGRKISSGTGASRTYVSDGLYGMAGTVYAHTGAMTFDTFSRSLMPKIRAAGGGLEVFGLCGNDVATTLTSLEEKKIRVTEPKKKYTSNVRTLECPGGVLHLLVSDFMDNAARRGQLITFQPKFMKRCYLRNLDVQFVPNLSLGNELADRAAFLVAEALMASNPAAICISTGITE